MANIIKSTNDLLIWKNNMAANFPLAKESRKEQMNTNER